MIQCSAVASTTPKTYQTNKTLNNDTTVQIYSLSDDESIISETDKPDSINDSVNKNDQTDDIYDVIDHLWKKGLLFLTVEMNTGEHEDVPFTLVQADDPIMAARYILSNDVDNSRDSVVIQRYSRWARCILRGIRRAERRLQRLQYYNKKTEKIRLSKIV